MTVFCWAARRRFDAAGARRRASSRSRPTRRCSAHCYWQPDRATRPTLLALHGLEGSSAAHYMRGIADKALRRRLQRRAAQSAQLRRHRASRPRPVPLRPDRRRRRSCIRELARNRRHRRVVVAGYSLGGNLALRLAGTTAAGPAAGAARGLRRLAGARARAVRPRARAPLELRLPVELRAQPEGADAPQERAAFPAASICRAWPQVRTVRQFDAAYTAPYFGFASAEDYYHRAAALRVVDRITGPGADHHGRGRSRSYRSCRSAIPKFAANPNITLVVTRHGGHCGFLGERRGGGRRWLLGGVVHRGLRRTHL